MRRSDGALPILRRLQSRLFPHYADADSRYGYTPYPETLVEMETGMETPSDILRQESIERWKRVMKALAVLYARYYAEIQGGEGELDGVRQDLDEDLDELMQAYDAWLD